jgi:hypothetical protein
MTSGASLRGSVAARYSLPSTATSAQRTASAARDARRGFRLIGNQKDLRRHSLRRGDLLYRLYSETWPPWKCNEGARRRPAPEVCPSTVTLGACQRSPSGATNPRKAPPGTVTTIRARDKSMSCWTLAGPKCGDCPPKRGWTGKIQNCKNFADFP